MVAAAFAVAGADPSAAVGEPKGHLQKDISTAKIIETSRGYAVDVSILASDFEEMFQKSSNERRGVDLSEPGVLELEIGRFVANRVAMRRGDGTICPNKVERVGEDPGNDEGVMVSMTFDCSDPDVVYDASKFLSGYSPRAWQIVTISRGGAQRQVMVNAESQPTSVAERR